MTYIKEPVEKLRNHTALNKATAKDIA